MGTPITDYVNLSLSISSAGLPAPDISIPLLMGWHNAWTTDLVREYTSVAAMEADGITGVSVNTGAGLHRMAEALMANNPAPPRFKVGRMTVGTVMTDDVTCLTDAVGETITITIEAPNGATETYSRACAGGGIPAEATALAALINGGAFAADLTATGVANDVQIRKDAIGGFAGQIYYYSGLKNCVINAKAPDTVGTTIAQQITAIRAEDDDWYGIAIDCPGDIAQEAVAAAILSTAPNYKCAFLSSQDDECLQGTAGNILKVLNAASNQRAVVVNCCHSMAEYPGVSAMGRMLSCNPGATTLAYQNLPGVTRMGTNAWDLTSAELAAIRADRGNAYVSLGTVGMVDGQMGVCSYARYVDERLLLDWLAMTIPVELVNAILSRTAAGTKIPYTNEAAEVARNCIYKVLQSAESWGAVMLRDPDTGENYFTFRALDASLQTSGNRLARIFAGIEFTCVITGAAQRFTLNGTLTFV